MTSTHNEETESLLPSTTSPAPSSSDPNPQKGLTRFASNLNLMPTNRDRLAVGCILSGIAIFLPLTWYMVFSGGVSSLGWFAFHPPMQSLGITALLGITPLQPPPASTAIRQTRFNTHQSLMLGLMLPAFAVGTAAMWWNKHVHGATHFTTWHSWFGLATIAWVVVQAMIGAGSVWFGGKAFGGEEKAKRVYKYHRLSGYLLVTLALLTAHLAGAHSTWALGRPHMKFVRVASFWVGLPLIWLGLVMRARPSKMKIV